MTTYVSILVRYKCHGPWMHAPAAGLHAGMHAWLQSNLYISILYNSITCLLAWPRFGTMGEIAYLFNTMHSQSVVPNLVRYYHTTEPAYHEPYLCHTPA